MRLFGFASMVAALSVALAPGADEKVEFKITAPKAKDKVKVTFDQKTVTKLTVSAPGSEVVTNETVVETHLKYTDDVEEVVNRKLKRFTRGYEKVSIKTNGKEAQNGKKAPPLQGKVVVIEWNDKLYEFSVRGGGVAGFDLEESEKALLADEFNKPDRTDLRNVMFPPNKEATVGKPWRMSNGLWVQSVGGPDFKLNGEKLTGEGKVLSAVKKTTKHLAEVNVDFVVPISNVTLGDKEKLIQTKEGSKLSVTIVSKGITDGTPPQDTNVKLMFDASVVSEGCDVRIEVTIETHTRKE